MFYLIDGIPNSVEGLEAIGFILLPWDALETATTTHSLFGSSNKC